MCEAASVEISDILRMRIGVITLGDLEVGAWRALSDEEIKEVLGRENEEFKTLSEEHSSLKAKLQDMKDKLHLTPEEEAEKATMKKLKLAKKDQMAEIIREYKHSHA